MTVRDSTTLKAYFNTGDIPTETQFADFIDTLFSRAAGTHTHAAADVTDFDEAARDALASALVAGTNVTITPDDGANTITIAATGGGGGGSGDMEAATYDPQGIADDAFDLAVHTGALPTGTVIAQPTLTLKTGTGSTTNAAVEFDTTAKTIKVGTGSGTYTVLASAHFTGDATVSTAGVVTFAGNSVDLAHISATGTPSATTYLRGDWTWATIAAAGDVSKVGTPVAGRMAYWTGDGTLGHEDGFEYDAITDTLTVAKIVVGGTTLDGTTLADPGGDRLMGWDDGLGTTSYFEIGDGLDLTDGVLSAAAVTTFTFPVSTTDPTTEGEAVWNGTTNFLKIGSGGATHTIPATSHFSGDATVSTTGVVTLAAGFYKSGGTDVAIADGGTGASTALGAVNNLSVGMASVSLTDGATITPDFSAGRNFHVTLGGNRTLANPTNQVAGQGGRILVTQDGTGSRTLAYGSNWKFFGSATLTTTAGAIDMIVYDVQASGTIYASLIKNAVAP